MNIKLSPFRMDESLVAVVSGKSITLNGDAIDFSRLPDGSTIHADAVNCKWIVGGVDMVNGVINITLRLPHGPDAPRETRFPDAFTNYMVVTDGAVPLPPYGGGI